MRGLAWLLAASISALVAHAGIDVLDGLGARANDDYGQRAHSAIGPMVAIALVLACTILARVVAMRLGRAGGIDPFVALGRSLSNACRLRSSIAVAAGSLCLLVAMEFSEQIVAAGHLEGIDDALGGNTPLGVAVVCFVATVVTLLGLRSARAALSVGVAAAEAFIAWISDARSVLAGPSAAYARAMQRRRHASEPAFLARTSGLRAPPATI